MKKVLALLLVCLLATSVAFAAVQFSGSLTAGLAIRYAEDAWNIHTYGDDGDDSDEMSLTLKFGDENDLWSAEVKGIFSQALMSQTTDSEGSPITTGPEQLTGESGKFEAIFKTNIAKAIAQAVGGESPVDVTFEIGGNRRVTTQRAYANTSGNNFDRARTLDGISPFGLAIGYKDFVVANVFYSPKWVNEDQNATVYGEDLAASIMVKPYSGIAVSADYVMNGENKAGGDPLEAGGIFAAAADINVGELAGLDFNLGVSVSDRYEFGNEFNQFAATVYGGVDMVSAHLEYALKSWNKAIAGGAVAGHMENYLHFGVDLAVVENMNLDVYFGADDVVNFATTYHVGGNIGYTLSGVKYNLGIEYAEGGSFGYDLNGLMIVPSVSVSF